MEMEGKLRRLRAKRRAKSAIREDCVAVVPYLGWMGRKGNLQSCRQEKMGGQRRLLQDGRG
jgi:hypothetical protein